MRPFLPACLLALAAPLSFAQSVDTGATIAVSFAATDSAPGPAAAPKKPISFDLAAIDKSVDPCVDFYQYSCGNWRKNNPIPSDQARWGRFNELAERNNYLLYTDLHRAAEDPKTPLQKKYGDFFAACMDVDQVNGLGDKPIEQLSEGQRTDRVSVRHLHNIVRTVYNMC